MDFLTNDITRKNDSFFGDGITEEDDIDRLFYLQDEVRKKYKLTNTQFDKIRVSLGCRIENWEYFELKLLEKLYNDEECFTLVKLKFL